MSLTLTQHSWQAPLARSQVENLHPPLTNQSRSAQEAGFSGILLACIIFLNGSFQKTSIPPPRRKLEVNPPTPFRRPNTFTIIRNNFVSPPPPDSRNFLRGGSVDLFWNDPILLACRIFSSMHCNLILKPVWTSDIVAMARWSSPMNTILKYHKNNAICQTAQLLRTALYYTFEASLEVSKYKHAHGITYEYVT